MKLFVIWLAVSSLISALPQKRFRSGESSKVVSDISKIVSKLPEQIKVEILQSSKETPFEDLFQIVNRDSNDGSSEYIIGGKNKQRYRVKLKKKSVDSGGSKVTATNNTYKYQAVSDFSNAADGNTEDVNQRYAESQGSAHESGDSKSAMKAKIDRNGYALNENEFVEITDNMKPSEINQPSIKKFRVSTQRTTYTKRTRIKNGSKFGSQELDDNSQISEVVQSICDYLNIKPEDVRLLTKTYLNLDINKPEDLNTLKLIYQDFVYHVKNNQNTKNISSFKKWLRQSKYWNKNIPQFSHEEPAEELDLEYFKTKHPKLKTKVITYPEINSEWVEGDSNHKIIKSRPFSVVHITEEIHEPEDPNKLKSKYQKSRPMPGSVVQVTEEIHWPEDINKLRSKYQEYLLSLKPNTGNIITFVEWLESRQNHFNIPEVSHDDLNMNKAVYQYPENSHEFDEQIIAPTSVIKTKKIYTTNIRPISSMEVNSQSSNKPMGFMYVKDKPKITITSKDIPDPGYLKIQKPNQELTIENDEPETKKVTSTKEWLNMNSEYFDKQPIDEVTTRKFDTENLNDPVEPKTEPSNHDQASLDLNPSNEYSMNLSNNVLEPGYLKIQKPNLGLTNEDHEPETKKVISTKELLNMNSEYFDKQPIDEVTTRKFDTENLNDPVEPKTEPSNHDQASLDLNPSNEYSMNLPNNVLEPGYLKIQKPNLGLTNEDHEPETKKAISTKELLNMNSEYFDKQPIDEVTTRKFDTENLNKTVESNTEPSKHNQAPSEFNTEDEFSMNMLSNENNVGTSENISTENNTMPEFNQDDDNINPQKIASTTILNNLGSKEHTTETYNNEEIETEINNFTNQDTVVEAKSPLGVQSEPLIIPSFEVAEDAPKALTSKETIITEEFDVDDLVKPPETKIIDTGADNEALLNKQIPPATKISDRDADTETVTKYILSIKQTVEPNRTDEIEPSLLQQKPTIKITNLVKYDGPDQSTANYQEIEPVTRKTVKHIVIETKQMPNDIAEDPLFAPHLFKPLEVDPTSLQQEPGSTKSKEDHVNHILNTHLPIIIKQIARVHPSKSRHDVYREFLLKLIKMFPELKRVIKTDFTLLDKEYYGLNPSLFDDPKSDTQFEELDPIGSSEIVPEIQIPRPHIPIEMLRSKPNIKETTLEEFISFFDPSNIEKAKKQNVYDDTLEVEHTITGDQVRDKLLPGLRSNKKDPNTSYFLLVPSTVIEDEEFKNNPWYKFIMKSDGVLGEDIPSKTQKYPNIYPTMLRSKEIVPTINNPVETLLDIPKPDYYYQYRLLANDILKHSSRQIFYYLMSARVPRANVISIINRINSEMTVHIKKYVSSNVCPSNDLNGFIEMLKLKIKKYIIGSSR